MVSPARRQKSHEAKRIDKSKTQVNDGKFKTKRISRFTTLNKQMTHSNVVSENDALFTKMQMQFSDEHTVQNFNDHDYF